MTLTSVSILSGAVGGMVVGSGPRQKGEDPAEVGEGPERRTTSELDVRVDNLERRVSTLFGSTEKGKNKSCECAAATRDVQIALSSRIDDIAKQMASLAERVEDMSVESSDRHTAKVAEFEQYLESTETHLQQGALDAAAKAVFDRLAITQESRRSVQTVAKAFIDERIADLRLMNNEFLRAGGHVEAASNVSRLEAANQRLLVELRSRVSDEQAEELGPLIHNLVSVPAYLVGDTYLEP